MTRKKDSEIVKAEREVLKHHTYLCELSKNMAKFIPSESYAPCTFDSQKYKAELLQEKSLSTLSNVATFTAEEIAQAQLNLQNSREELAILEVTQKRYLVANRVVKLKGQRSQFQDLLQPIPIGNGQTRVLASKSQRNHLAEIKLSLRKAINQLGLLPELGCTYAGWAGLPVEEKSRPPGHPKTTSEEEYVTTRNARAIAHKNVNNSEEYAKQPKSTIDQIVARTQKLNAGRSKMPPGVVKIEKLENNRRTILADITSINDSTEPGKTEGRGKRPQPKEKRLQLALTKLHNIDRQLNDTVGELSHQDYILYLKRIFEREKRYQKEDGHSQKVNAIEKHIVSLKRLLDLIKNNNATIGARIRKKAEKIHGNTKISIDEKVNKVLANLKVLGDLETQSKLSTREKEMDILEVFETMQLPVF
jgi:hypothetical protein